MRSAFYIIHIRFTSVFFHIFCDVKSSIHAIRYSILRGKSYCKRENLSICFLQKTSIGGVSVPSRKPKPYDECGEPETDENDEKTRQHNFKHCAYHRTLFFARDVAFLAFMSGRVFPILKSGAPIFWQFVAVHGGYGHAVVPVVLSVFSAHTDIIACIPCKINRFFLHSASH